MDSKIKVRFAPSPTGILHVGGIRTALFNYFFARSKQGEFVLRNEDTDQARKVEGSVEATLESLKWLGADWDDFVTQSERLDEYRNYANQLLEKGHAREEEGAVRFITPKEGTTKWHDLIGDKDISFENSDIEDFIILKKDGYPTYHLANVIDDHLMGISHVIRGEDWIPSAPKHLMLYEAFGWIPPQFAHVPNVMGTDGKKLSKRRGAKSVLDFKNEGYLSEALLNYLMLLGWSPKNDREVLSRDEIEKEFSLERVNSAPAIFDERKLLWMNGEYIRRTPISNLKSQILEINPELGDLDQELIDKLLVPAQTRMKKLIEFKDYVLPFINPVTTKSPLLNRLGNALETVMDWNNDKIMEVIVSFLQNENVKYPQIYQDLIGQKQGLPLGEVFVILGKEKTLTLLK